MSNPNANPLKARQAKRSKRRAQPGTLTDARELLWRALTRAGELLDAQTVDSDGEATPDNQTALKAIHAISQGASSYARLVEVGELEARLEALEALSGDSGPRLGKGAA